MKDASVFGIFGCIDAKNKMLKKDSINQKALKEREIPIPYVTRGQAQVMCVLYVESVPKGSMDITWYRDLLNNTLNILSSFNLLWTEPLLGIAK